ncbi:MAG: filamentous hemagglutinin N-terminal domain-containing protein [Verrucomicrobiota bacterium]
MAARCLAPLVLAGGCWLLPAGDAARGAPSMRAGAMAQGMSSSASATSQVATSATDSTSQIVSTSVLAQRAQASLSKSVQALNALKAAQAAAHNAAINSLIQNLGLNPNAPGTTLRDVANGLGGNAALGLNGGLVPAGGPLQQVGGANSQTVDLATGNSVSVGGKGGSVILANGTPGNDKVAVSGAGSITTSGGTVTATSGSLSTQSGATISTTVGGSITVTGGKSTLSFSSNTNLSSSLGGTVTLPGGQGTVTLPANTAVTIPAGSIVTFSGASAGAVSIAGAAAAQVGDALRRGHALAGRRGVDHRQQRHHRVQQRRLRLARHGQHDQSQRRGQRQPRRGAARAATSRSSCRRSNVVTQVPVAFTTTGTVLNTESFGVPANWKGVGGLSQSTNASTGAVVDTVTQSTQQALLFWSQFDIGKKTTLDFDQSAGGANVSQWVAINEITDPSLAPSQILGHIEAPGQVYVINQNGIIFGGSSQVNVGALTASSLALNPNYINNGLLNDSANSFQFQFSSLVAETPVNGRVRPAIPASVAPLFTAPTGSQTVVAVPAGNVTVQAGARLTSPATADGQGGRIALVAPNVVNQGTISTPDGQTILAAGLQVGFSAHNSNDPSLRGLDVFIGRVQSPAGSLPTGTFTFNGLPEDALNQSSGTFTLADETLTFAGSGQVGSFTPSGGKATPIMGGVPVTIPIGSTVVINAGVKTPGFAAIGTATPSTAGAAGTAGAVANAANAFNAQGAMTTPGGDVESSDGDITMAGSVVNQLGVLNGSTSVTLNGRIDLLADFNTAAGTINTSEPDGTIVTTQAFFPSASGTVTLGGQSVTQILPDASNATTIGTELANTSIVNVQGLDLEMQANALLLAPGAGDNLINPTGNPPVFDLVNKPITSGVTFNAGSWVTSGSSSMFTNTTGVINIGSNATIDVSGSEDVSASVLQDIVEAQLRGPQFADSPLQRNGGLRGDTVFIDIRNAGVFDGTPWIGSPIGDLSGFVNDVERTVGELTIGGGTVALTAGKSVSTGSGALINVSGGWINYTGATVQTTNVLANGEIINISQATPNLSFGGISSGFIATSPKWGVTQTFLNALTDGTQFDPGYIQGGGGGGINITAPSMSLQGGFFGQVVAGPYQRTPQMGTSSLASTFTSNGVAASFLPTELQIAGVPQTSSLDLAFMQNLNGIASTLQPATNLDIRFATDATIAASVPSANNVLLSEDIVNQDGFGDLTVNAAAGGTITVPAGVSLTGVAGGALSLTANDITIGGSISMPAGSMSFSVDDIPTSVPSPVASNGNQITPPPIAANGVFELAPGASLSAAGLVVDDRTGAPEPMELPDEVNGGSISIAALKVDLAVGSTINVSGGLDIASNKQQTFGIGGSLSILGGKDPGTPTLVQSGSLLLGSIMTGYSGSLGGGGSLTIQSPLVQVGGSMLLNGDNGEHSSLGMYTGETGVAGNGNTLWLDPGNGASGDFFSQGGFENFTIEGIGQQETLGGKLQFAANGNPDISPAVLIAPGMVVDPVVESFVSVLGANNGGLSAQTLAQTEALLPSQRSSVNLTFEALGINNAPPGDTPPLNASGAGFGNGGGLLMRGDVVLSAGAQIITGPQTNVNNGVSLLAPNGTVAVLGTVEAPGGTITISGGNTTSQSDNDLLFFGTGSNVNLPFATVLLASGSLLSTAGVTELTPNTLGLRTGNELNGGDITISGNIVAESGATIDVSGASDVLNETAAQEGTSGNTFRTMRPMDDPVASNAGTITLAGTQMLLSDATLLGRGGAVSTAAGQGGTLNVSVGSSAQTGNASVAPPVPQDVEIIVSQMGLGGGGFSIPPGSAGGIALLGTSLAIESTGIGATVNAGVGGAPVDGYFAVSPNLFVNGSVDASANDNGGWAGGFVNLVIPGTIDFIGNVNITAAQSIQLAESTGGGDSGTGGVIEAGGRVVVTAPYVALNSFTQSLKPDPIIAAGGSYPAATGGTGALMVNADVLADVGNLSLQDIDNLTFNANAAAAGDVRGIGTLQVAGTGTIQMNAAQVYPPTEQTFTIEAGTAIFGASGQPLPALPLSGGGTLDVDANVIMQDGVLRAPFGVINLGTSGTSAITLGAGSITSVSGVDPTTGQGIIVPYGLIDASGQWFDPMGNNITLTGPPVKAINITGNDIKLLPGSTLDERGGGELLAYQFNPGLGGNQDILASDASFAIIPGFTAKYARTAPSTRSAAT